MTRTMGHPDLVGVQVKVRGHVQIQESRFFGMRFLNE